MAKDSGKARRRQRLIKRDGPGCFLCGLEERLTLHHIKKQEHGGNHDLDNLVQLCEDCHTYWHQVDQHNKIDFFKWVKQTQSYLGKMLYD